MFQNYLKIALRQLLKNKWFSVLNIFGLATGMAVCMLVIMAVQDQYGYDAFHENGDRIYRVISAEAEKGAALDKATHATCQMSLLEPLQQGYPIVKAGTHVVQVGNDITLHDKVFSFDYGGYAVDQAFLDLFSFGWKEGNQLEALAKPRSIVLTETTAKKLFPDGQAIGTTVKWGELGDFAITGIIPEPPHRSHIRFEYLVSYQTFKSLSEEDLPKAGINGFDEIWRGHTYVLLSKKAERASLDEALSEQAAAYSAQSKKMHYHFQSQPLADVMPSHDLANEIGVGTPHIVLYFLMALGLIIILSACFNYMNLSLARSIKRSKEIGVRKVIGAGGRDIAKQLLGEALLISTLAFVVAVGLLQFLIPAFYNLDAFVASIFQLDQSFENYLIFFGFSLLVGVVAGMVPALNIAGFQPLQAMQQLGNVKVFSRIGLRKALVTTQFAMSLIFILAVIIVLRQQNHVLDADLGQNIHNLLSVKLQGLDYDLFAQKASQIKGVESVSSTSVAMLTGENNDEMAHFNDRKDSVEVAQSYVSPDFMANMDIPLLAGKNFPENNRTEGEQFAVVNETAVKRMGYESPEAALGQPIIVDSVALSIIGVAKDFHHDNIWFSPIKPFLLRNKSANAYNAYVRLSGENKQETLASLQAIWKELSPKNEWFAFYLEERVYNMAKFFRMGSSIIGFVGFLTIVIACLGLLGMVVYTVEGKVKEVGIRKVLGASETNIIWQLSKGFLLLMGVAILVAVPITLFVSNLWLNNFLLRITVGPWILATGIGILLGLGLITVLSQTFSAASANPVKSLRSE